MQTWRGVSPLPVQTWRGVSPLPEQMATGSVRGSYTERESPVPVRMWQGGRSRDMVGASPFMVQMGQTRAEPYSVYRWGLPGTATF